MLGSLALETRYSLELCSPFSVTAKLSSNWYCLVSPRQQAVGHVAAAVPVVISKSMTHDWQILLQNLL